MTNVQDNCARVYFVKCNVRASMNAVSYAVEVGLSLESGSVRYADCHTCKQSSLARCSHIISVLLFIVQHVEQYGNKGKLHSSIFSFPVLWRYKVKPTLFFPLGYFPPVVTVHVSLLKNFVACFKLFCNQCLLSSL